MSWIEFNMQLRDHWKVNRLKEILGIRYAEALGLLGCLWTWAGEYAENGDLSKFTKSEIESGMRWEGEKNLAIKALKSSKLLENKNGKLSIHDWEKHGIRLILSSRMRQKIHRDNVTLQSHDCNVLPTSPSIPSIPSILSIPLKNNPPNPLKGEVVIPAEFESCKGDVTDWLAYKKERGQGYKPTGLNALWGRLREIPEARRGAAIRASMAANYAGIFESKSGGKTDGKTHGGVAAVEGKYDHVVQ